MKSPKGEEIIKIQTAVLRGFNGSDTALLDVWLSVCVMVLQMSLAFLPIEMWLVWDVDCIGFFLFFVAGVEPGSFAVLNQRVTHHCLPVRGLSATTYSEMQQIFL